METPQYDRWDDDDIYRFLGRYIDPAYKIEYDLYWCWNSGIPTVVAIHGNFPMDYTRGFWHARYHRGIREAIKRAKERNYAI